MLLILDNYTLLLIISLVDIKDYRNLLYTCKRLKDLCSAISMQKYCIALMELFIADVSTVTSVSALPVSKLFFKLIYHTLILSKKTVDDVFVKLITQTAPHTGKNLLYLHQLGFNVSGFNCWYNFQLSRFTWLILCSIDFTSRISKKVSEGIVAVIHNEVELTEDFYFYNTCESNKLKSVPYIKVLYKNEYSCSRNYSESQDVLEPVCIALKETFFGEDDVSITPQTLCNLMKNDLKKQAVNDFRLLTLQSQMEQSVLTNLKFISQLQNVNKLLLDNLKTICNQLNDPGSFINQIIEKISDSDI